MNSTQGPMGIYVKLSENRGRSLLGQGRLFVITLCLIGLTVFYTAPAWSLDAAQRKAFIASIPQGETFENDGTTYAYLPTLQGEKDADRKLKSFKNEQLTSDREAFVQQKGPFTIYKRGAALKIQSDRSPAHQVVLNLERNSLGILTGNLWLKLKDLEVAQSLADTYGMTLTFINTPMSTAFYETRDGIDILALRRVLNKDPRIVRVTLDIVDRISRPR